MGERFLPPPPARPSSSSTPITLDALIDDVWGPPGSPRRDRMDRNMTRWDRAESLAWRVTRFWPRWMAIFWTRPIHDRSLRPYGWLDLMSFCYLGDFLFYGYPVTQSYQDSWMSRVHLPWRR